MSSELATQNQPGSAISYSAPITFVTPPSFAETMKIASALAQSGFFKDCRNPEQAFAKILAGQEIGIGAMAALTQIHIVDGKPTLDASLIGAQVKKSGRYDYRVKTLTDEICILEFFERGKSVGESSFSMEEAKRAGLTGKDVWKKYPKDMLRSRAITRGARTFCPDVFNGAVYTPDEAGAEVAVEGETMQIVSAQVETMEPRQQPLSQEDAEKLACIKKIIALVWVDPELKTEAPNLRRKAVAEALALAHVPTRWDGFTLDQLNEFITLATPLENVSYCDLCNKADGSHEDDCAIFRAPVNA